MKKRIGFVSNSSSSSFIIDIKNLNAQQILSIFNHAEEGKEMGILYSEENEWNIQVNKKQVKGYTNMDNFDMITFLEKIGVDDKYIKWSE